MSDEPQTGGAWPPGPLAPGDTEPTTTEPEGWWSGGRVPSAGPGDDEAQADLNAIPDLSYRRYRWRTDVDPDELPTAG